MYKVVGPLGYDTYPQLCDIPKYIKDTLKCKADIIQIINTDDDKSSGDFEKQMRELESEYMELEGYIRVTPKIGYLNKNLTYYVMKGEHDSAISYYETAICAIVTRATTEEVVVHMSDDDVIENELWDDRPGLRGIDCYDERVKQLQKEIESELNAFKELEALME